MVRVAGLSVMRVQGTIILLAVLGAAQAQASSIETLLPTDVTPSIIMLGEETAIDPSVVAAVAETEPTPSIVTLADTPATPSIIALGDPADGAIAAAPSPQRQAPMVIRGGEVGAASARPPASSAQPATRPGVPLLDPDDRGTPAKRKALKEQEERLARQAAGAQDQQPDPSTEPAPLGR